MKARKMWANMDGHSHLVCVNYKPTDFKATPILVQPFDAESVEELRDRLLILMRDQEMRCDGGWEPGFGDLVDETLVVLGITAKRLRAKSVAKRKAKS